MREMLQWNRNGQAQLVEDALCTSASPSNSHDVRSYRGSCEK
jgi:hypothetical protein